MIGAQARVVLAWIDNHRTIEPERLLSIHVVVRVVQIRAGLRRIELITIKAAICDWLLGNMGGTVHDVRQDQTVPMHGGRFRQSIRDV